MQLWEQILPSLAKKSASASPVPSICSGCADSKKAYLCRELAQSGFGGTCTRGAELFFSEVWSSWRNEKRSRHTTIGREQVLKNSDCHLIVCSLLCASSIPLCARKQDSLLTHSFILSENQSRITASREVIYLKGSVKIYSASIDGYLFVLNLVNGELIKIVKWISFIVISVYKYHFYDIYEFFICNFEMLSYFLLISKAINSLINLMI